VVGHQKFSLLGGHDISSRRKISEDGMAEPQLRRFTPDEFFAWQRNQDKNYELVDGLPVLPLKMMTGASRAHDKVVVNVIRELATQLRGGPGGPTTDDLAVRIPAGNVRRPDIAIECAEGDRRDMEVREPRVVVEVLSPSTRTLDRFRKLVEYQSIGSLHPILRIDTETPRIDIVTREADAPWVPETFQGFDAVVDLPAVGASLRLADVFEGVPFETL
jgi:Uma2 family endonuclease